jgi:hypothetical protein
MIMGFSYEHLEYKIVRMLTHSSVSKGTFKVLFDSIDFSKYDILKWAKVWGSKSTFFTEEFYKHVPCVFDNNYPTETRAANLKYDQQDHSDEPAYKSMCDRSFVRDLRMTVFSIRWNAPSSVLNLGALQVLSLPGHYPLRIFSSYLTLDSADPEEEAVILGLHKMNNTFKRETGILLAKKIFFETVSSNNTFVFRSLS